MENLVNFSGHTTVDGIRRFCFGGHAHFTLESRVSGQHYTFEISRKELGGKEFWFSAVMTNGEQYTYIGRIVASRDIKLTAKSRLTEDSPAVRALAWFLRKLAAGVIPDSVVVYHSGRCGCCGRELTSPDSVAIGIGPECLKKL
jgi:hypothetical protein